jgi:periplasmic divalent cation tolerance protein
MSGLLVFCNVPDQAVADQLAAKLIEERLAACVNILAPCRSVYCWEGKIEVGVEVPLIIKTTRRQYPELEARIQSLHPYQVPEIIACDIDCGLPAYLTWVEDAVISRASD